MTLYFVNRMIVVVDIDFLIVAFFIVLCIFGRLWTTEQEINFFLEKSWSNSISQTIQEVTNENDTSSYQLTNRINLVKGGYFGVQGDLSLPTDDNNVRTNFVFTSATLDLPWLPFDVSIPPIGKGWFDTLYLDDTFRIDINSRKDILICCREY